MLTSQAVAGSSGIPLGLSLGQNNFQEGRYRFIAVNESYAFFEFLRAVFQQHLTEALICK